MDFLKAYQNMIRKIKKSQPTSSDVHVPTAGKEEDIKKDTETNEEGLNKAREEVVSMSEEELEAQTAESWLNRALACIELGDIARAEELGHEALEHASLVKDLGETVGFVQRRLMDAGLWQDIQVTKDHDPNNLETFKAKFHKFLDSLNTGPDNTNDINGLRSAFDTFIAEEGVEKVAKNILAKRLVTVAILHENKILMGKRNDNKKWTCPGGHVNPSETFKEGAEREVLEETGIQVDARFLFPVSQVTNISTKFGGIQVQSWMYQSFDDEEPTAKNDPDKEFSEIKWIDYSEGLPEEVASNLHVPKDRDLLLPTLGIVRKSGVNADSDTDMYPGIDNLEGGLLKTDEGSNQQFTDFSSMQAIIEGMDYELSHGMVSQDNARIAAIANLAEDPQYYQRKDWEENAREDLIDNNVVDKDTLENEESPLANVGFNIDLGSGSNREPGHLGFDIYPYDYGTYLHDLNLGIPLEDNSVRKVQMRNAFHTMELDDPKALLSEITRVTMPGGQFVYQGPNEVQNQPDFREDLPGWELVSEKPIEKGNEGVPGTEKIFTRLAVPDPATANDAEPRVGIAQYDMLPADALLAMDAVGYYYSDATSSGRGNRLHGYASQGALLNKAISDHVSKGPKWERCVDDVDAQGSADNPYAVCSESVGIQNTLKEYAHEGLIEDSLKGGPGSGPGSGQHMSQEQKNRLIRADQNKWQAAHKADDDDWFQDPNNDKVKARDIKKDISDACNEGQRGWRLPTTMEQYEVPLEVGAEELAQRSKNRSPLEKVLKSIRSVPIIKAVPYKQILYCVVLEPHTEDAQEDIMSPEEIEKTAHKYLENSRVIGGEHSHPIDAVPVESFIAPQDFSVNGQYGDQVVKAGSWVLGVKIKDPDEWQKVLDGDYTGVSIGGFGQREELV
jgi:8-oxo-dGTP pyrophosphatase MutT (NUDIX family)